MLMNRQTVTGMVVDMEVATYLTEEWDTFSDMVIFLEGFSQVFQ